MTNFLMNTTSLTNAISNQVKLEGSLGAKVLAFLEDNKVLDQDIKNLNEIKREGKFKKLSLDKGVVIETSVEKINGNDLFRNSLVGKTKTPKALNLANKIVTVTNGFLDIQSNPKVNANPLDLYKDLDGKFTNISLDDLKKSVAETKAELKPAKSDEQKAIDDQEKMEKWSENFGSKLDALEEGSLERGLDQQFVWLQQLARMDNDFVIDYANKLASEQVKKSA
tara:strand:+ start:1588 stop:2259 length:672 start_codon:yes stop_codon:yes gene_type:complete